MLGAESEKKKEEQRKALRANINKVANLYRDEKKAEVQDHNGECAVQRLKLCPSNLNE